LTLAASIKHAVAASDFMREFSPEQIASMGEEMNKIVEALIGTSLPQEESGQSQ
jgi:hypothetical protein